MPSANANLADRHLVHALHLERLKASETSEIRKLLARMERDLMKRLMNTDLTSWRKTRYQALVEQVQNTLRPYYRAIRDTHTAKLAEVADLEATWTARSLSETISDPVGVYIGVASQPAWNAETLQAIASDVVFEGSPVRLWWGKQATDLRRRFGNVVKQGLLRGEGTDAIIRAVRGTAAMNYTDGIMEVSRNQAETLVRSSIQAVTHTARRAVYAKNADLIKGVMQLSTLDSRTCLTGETLVSIPGGEKRISAFRVGDTVIGGSGKTREVVGTRQVKTRKIAVVKLSNGETIRCTPDHLFLLKNQTWQEAQDLEQGVILAERRKV